MSTLTLIETESIKLARNEKVLRAAVQRNDQWKTYDYGGLVILHPAEYKEQRKLKSGRINLTNLFN